MNGNGNGAFLKWGSTVLASLATLGVAGLVGWAMGMSQRVTGLEHMTQANKEELHERHDPIYDTKERVAVFENELRNIVTALDKNSSKLDKIMDRLPRSITKRSNDDARIGG